MALFAGRTFVRVSARVWRPYRSPRPHVSGRAPRTTALRNRGGHAARWHREMAAELQIRPSRCFLRMCVAQGTGSPRAASRPPSAPLHMSLWLHGEAAARVRFTCWRSTREHTACTLCNWLRAAAGWVPGNSARAHVLSCARWRQTRSLLRCAWSDRARAPTIASLRHTTRRRARRNYDSRWRILPLR